MEEGWVHVAHVATAAPHRLHSQRLCFAWFSLTPEDIRLAPEEAQAAVAGAITNCSLAAGAIKAAKGPLLPHTPGVDWKAQLSRVGGPWPLAFRLCEGFVRASMWLDMAWRNAHATHCILYDQL